MTDTKIVISTSWKADCMARSYKHIFNQVGENVDFMGDLFIEGNNFHIINLFPLSLTILSSRGNPDKA